MKHPAPRADEALTEAAAESGRREAVKWNHIRWHNGTVNLTIKNIPEDVHKTLKRTAAARGRSLNAEVLRLLQEGAQLEERRERIKTTWDDFLKFRASMPKLRTSSARLIREDRETR
jgi:plasmid stability protein